MFRTAVIVALAVVLASCQTDQRDSGGTPISIQPVEGRTLHDAMLWLPAGIIESVATFSVRSRNNTHPIEDITLSAGRGEFYGQYLRGYAIGFSQETTREILDEDHFTERASSLGVRDYELENVTSFGSTYTTNGGVLARYERGQFYCVAGRVGAGLGGFNVALSTHGAPYDTIIALSFCGTLEQADEVEAFLRNPQQVEDRAAFTAYVDQILADADAQNGTVPKS